MLEELQVKAMLCYLFGSRAKEIDMQGWSFERSKRTGRLKYVRNAEGKLLFVVREDGTMAPTLDGARVLLKHGAMTDCSVIVGEQGMQRLVRGYNVLAAQLEGVGKGIRPKSDVIILDKSGNVRGVGRAVLSAHQLKFIRYGIAVKVRRVEA
ncbi:MAG: hypothetical protein C4339_00685 [Nitrososphaerota archaeon]